MQNSSTTTFILHGGETSKNNPDNDLFFKHFTQFVDNDHVKILMCYFAKEPTLWDARLESDRHKIESQTSKKVSLSIAGNPEDLLEKLDSHDVLYVAGGNAEPLESCLPRLQGLKKKLMGKVYLGCSMGAFIVSSKYVLAFPKQAPDEVHEGLQLLPINTLCHWNVLKDRQHKVHLLKNAAPQTPILTLNECKSTLLIN